MKQIEVISAKRLQRLLEQLELSQRGASRFLGVDERTVRHWIAGEKYFVDPATAMLLELMVKHSITPAVALASIGINLKAAERKAPPGTAPRFYKEAPP